MLFETVQNPAIPLIQILSDLVMFINEAGTDRYAENSSAYYSASPGSHIRHILDHAGCLAEALRSKTLNYDDRIRGTEIEVKSELAKQRIEEIIQTLSQFRPQHLGLPVRVRILLSPEGPMQDFGSTLGRELGFVISHTIHHNAILAAMARDWNMQPDPEFGLAPATIAHQRSDTCAH